ncbi:tRNA1(Val) (adenine(37)-N6)-methyltransferase [uncultured bacterium]|nr:tRNA1(Val) (adenine(37)-N6)-methyltransferase [uncultured bacterium]
MKRPTITENETIESLGPYFLIQRKAGHRLTSDTVALAVFAAKSISEKDKVIDLGTATGALLLLLAWKTGAEKLIGVEIDKEAALTAGKNIEANGLEARAGVLNADYRDLPAMYPEGAFSAIVSNPPYTKAGTGRVSPKAERAIARSEVKGGLAELVRVSKHLAGKSGKIFYVFPVTRLSEMLIESQKCGLNARRLRFVHTGKGAEPRFFLVELGIDGGMEMEEPLFL